MNIDLKTEGGYIEKPFDKYWSGTDLHGIFERNLKANPNHSDLLYYKDNPITYDLNSEGMRTPDEMSSEPGNVFLGCSHTFGLGHYLENTWAYTVSQYIGGKFWNFGKPGSGIASGFRTLVHYIDKLTIKNVFLYYPHPYRYEFFDNTRWFGVTINTLDLQPHIKNVANELFEPEYCYLHNLSTLYAINYLCKQKGVDVYYYNSGYMYEIQEKPNSPVKEARDLAHMSVDANYTIANIFIERYKNKETYEKRQDKPQVDRDTVG